MFLIKNDLTYLLNNIRHIINCYLDRFKANETLTRTEVVEEIRRAIDISSRKKPKPKWSRINRRNRV